MDVDGDGYISMYELEYFYEEQMQRMEAIGIETLPFNDCLCQVRATPPDPSGNTNLGFMQKNPIIIIKVFTIFASNTPNLIPFENKARESCA